jgi:hypothetical protein
MNEGCQQIILAFFGESWPSSANRVGMVIRHEQPGCRNE